MPRQRNLDHGPDRISPILWMNSRASLGGMSQRGATFHSEGYRLRKQRCGNTGAKHDGRSLK
jgi:hypothetical protein